MRNFNEVLISEICKKVGINCVEALFAKAVLAEGFEGDFSLNARGCLIKSYLTKDIIESIPFEDIGAFYCEKMIWAILNFIVLAPYVKRYVFLRRERICP